MNRNVLKVVNSLGLHAYEVPRFIKCLEEESAARPAIIWTHTRPLDNPFKLRRMEYTDHTEQSSILGVDSKENEQLFELEKEFISNGLFDFIDLLADGQCPGTHRLHEQGDIYCLDFSSVFAASVLSEAKLSNRGSPNLVVDTCSSPGGKAIYAWTACKPKRLVCNEVIGSRLSALISNIKRCQITPTIVTNADTAHLAVSLGETADIVLVDAPCSGQSLPAKGAKAFGAFHPATINMNSNRQKRILANSAKVVAPGGYLAYMTCTFSIDENEGVIKWFLKRFPNFEPQIVPHLAGFRSRISEFPCYRLMPHQGLGAGAFTCLLKNKDSSENKTIPDWQSLKCVWRNDQIPEIGT